MVCGLRYLSSSGATSLFRTAKSKRYLSLFGSKDGRLSKWDTLKFLD